MCMECRQTPCHPRCPNAPDPKPVYECEYCHDGIYEGDDCVRHGNDYYHDDCFRDVAYKIMIEEYVDRWNVGDEF